MLAKSAKIIKSVKNCDLAKREKSDNYNQIQDKTLDGLGVSNQIEREPNLIIKDRKREREIKW